MDGSEAASLGQGLGEVHLMQVGLVKHNEGQRSSGLTTQTRYPVRFQFFPVFLTRLAFDGQEELKVP